MDWTTLRQQTTFAVSSAKARVDGTHFQTMANVLPLRRKYRTAQLRNTGLNCSRKRSDPSVPGFKMPTCEKHLSHSPNTVQESTVFAFVKENNKHLT
jgi:hypothetical protein